MSSPATPLHVPTANPALDHSKLGSAQHSVGGLGLVPVQTRSERFASFAVTDFQPVRSGDPEWKYTPLEKIPALLADVVDGTPLEQEVTIDGDATVEWVDRDDARIGSAGKPEDRAAAAAWSNFEKATAITFADSPAAANADAPARVRIVRNALGATARAAHTVITARGGSRGVVLLENFGPASLTENVEIVLEDDAELTVISVQEWADDAKHLASHFARVGQRARLRHVVVTLGGDVVRINPATTIDGARGEAELFGLYYADAGQHIEHQVFVHHNAADTVSRVNYKGALQGEGAHTAWIGDVLISQAGTGTDSYEQNRNLLLTEGARADSVPNLEIETGEIAGAGHASTSGRFDDEQLFYLQSRGLPEAEARRLVVRGFLAEIVQKIGIPELEQRLTEALEEELRVSV